MDDKSKIVADAHQDIMKVLLQTMHKLKSIDNSEILKALAFILDTSYAALFRTYGVHKHDEAMIAMLEIAAQGILHMATKEGVHTTEYGISENGEIKPLPKETKQ